MDCETFVMEPGSVLYMPKGVVHYAETRGEEMSVHMTLGLLQDSHTWQDMLMYGCLHAKRTDCQQLEKAFKSLFANEQGVEWRDLIPFWRNTVDYHETDDHVSEEFLNLAVARVSALLEKSRDNGLMAMVQQKSQAEPSYLSSQHRAIAIAELFASLENPETIKAVVKMIAEDDNEGDEMEAKTSLGRLKRLRRGTRYYRVSDNRIDLR